MPIAATKKPTMRVAASIPCGPIRASTILAARKNAMEVAGYHVAESELIASEAFADIDPIEVYLKRAAKEIEDNKPEVASKSLALTLVRGVLADPASVS